MVLAGSLPFLAGCTYVANRLNDLSDVAHVDLTVSMGLLANVGPAVLGAEWTPDRLQLGLGGPQWIEFGTGPSDEGQTAYGYVVRCERLDVAARWYGLPMESLKTEPQGYGKSSPPWGSIGVEVGVPVPLPGVMLFPLGVGVHADVVELADFVTGFGGVDILGDDL
jgi:hypothetical protein